ncbi:MAG TPA: tetratricopeptide repeat protein, partial [candidate division Zixibacteria bacterium]
MQSKKKEKASTRGTDPQSGSSPVGNITVAVSLFLLFLLWLAAFFPEKRLWGINHWAYFPFWLRTALIAAACLSFVPAVRQRLTPFLNPPVVKIFGFLTERRKLLGYLMVPLLSLVLFYLLRTKTHLLGDGFQILDSLQAGSLTPNWSQPLAIRVYLNSYHLLDRLFGLDGASVYALISYLAGMIFVIFAIRLAVLLAKTTSTRLFVFLILMLMGSTELFFGYAEHYPLLCAGILIYIFYCLKYLRKEINFLTPLMIYIILVPFHFSSLFLLPSLLFLFLFREEERRLPRLLKEKVTWLLLLCLLILFVGLVLYLSKYNWFVLGYLMPVLHGVYTGPHYTLFSPDHIIDFLNQQLLISPIGFALCLIFLIFRPRNLNVKKRAFQFLLIVASTQLLFNFIINPGLGAPRDWDLFASAGLGYTVLALFLFTQISPDSRLSHLKLNLVIVAFLFVLPWILINASPEKSVARFRNILDLDPKKSRNGHFILAGYFDRAGKPEETKKENQKIMEIFPELELYQQGMMLLAKNDLTQAYQYFTRSLQIAPDFAEAHAGLGWYYLTRGDLKKSESEYKQALQLKPDYPIAYSDLGDVYMKESKFEDAERMYRRALKLKVDDPRIYNNLGILYVQLGDLKKATSFYREAISVKQDFVESYYGLAYIYVQQGKFQEALNQIDRLLQINPNFALAYYLQGSIYEKTGRNKEAVDAYQRY